MTQLKELSNLNFRKENIISIFNNYSNDSLVKFIPIMIDLKDYADRDTIEGEVTGQFYNNYEGFRDCIEKIDKELVKKLEPVQHI